MRHQGTTGSSPRWKQAPGVASTVCAVLAFGAILMTARAIPYAVSPVSGFAANPMASDVTLPPLPDALKPMGPPKAAPISVVSPLPPATGPKSGPGAGPTTTGLSSDGNGGTTINGDNTNGTLTVDGADVSDEPGQGHSHPRGQTTVTTNDSSGFLDWVRQNQDAAALARAARSHYNQAAPSPSESATDDDLMLNIRYPYLWNQEQPPGGGAVIYSIKR